MLRASGFKAFGLSVFRASRLQGSGALGVSHCNKSRPLPRCHAYSSAEDHANGSTYANFGGGLGVLKLSCTSRRFSDFVRRY